jgi:hypothetical protein
MRSLLALIPSCALALALVAGSDMALAAQLQASAPECRATQILTQMRSATGAGNWAGIAETSAYGRVVTSGLRGTGRFDNDVVRGRSALRFNVAVMGSEAQVYDGSTVWSQDISGGVRPYDSPYARKQSITDAYLARRGYFNQSDPATLTCLGKRLDGGRSITVIRVQPSGGSPADLAIDAQTHLLTSVTERAPLEMSIVTYADYRTIGGVVLPFSLSSGTKADRSADYSVAVTRYALRHSARDTDFAKPIPPANARIVGGSASTAIPMKLEGRQLLVWASINGLAPMPFILDTGGHAILTSAAAKAMNLSGLGAGTSSGAGTGTISTQYARVKSIRIGNAELLDQPMLVIPYPYSFYERGKNVPLAGIIGLEFFERFVTRLDYGERTVTFTSPSAFRYRGHGTTVPFTFESEPDMPMVEAAADGHPGLFGIDTGNAGILILFGDYLRHTGILTRYAPGILLIGLGTGGTNTGRLQTLARFAIGASSLTDVASNFTQMTSGAFSASTQAGNMGLSILSRFIPTFDYARQVIHLDPPTRPTAFSPNRGGLGFVKNEPDAFDVILVTPRAPAASAGIVIGDHIVGVNGKPASAYSSADLFDLIAQPAGTELRLRVQHAGTTRDTTIVLR